MKRVLFYIVVVVGIVSCHRPEYKWDTIDMVRKLDSLTVAWKEVDTLFPGKKYDTVLFDAANKNETQQFFYTIQDFHAYIDNLRYRFYRACGDSTSTRIPAGKEQDISLTNAFIESKDGTLNVLHGQLEGVFDSVRSMTRDNKTIQDKVLHLEMISTNNFISYGKLMLSYFKDQPPATVISIINNFDQNVRHLAKGVLNDYLNK